MPDIPVKDSRLPELRLPEISRDDIVRSLSEIRRPDIDLTSIELPRVDLSAMDLPSVDWSRELTRVTDGLGARLLGRRQRRRSRRPWAVAVLAVVALAVFAILSRPSVRDRMALAARDARRRAEARFSGEGESEAILTGVTDLETTMATDAEEAAADAVAIAIEPDAFPNEAPAPDTDTASVATLEEATATPA